ncbi:MAG: oxygen-independent coproporphyrinogen III oxidase-like protein [Burkholderiales bacterium]|jgi:oxygen-independent coproporphyrinogen-3 oxidase|nr:oxygen-independent coproporphyrinogen III oxidase-like protein [Burkholderiales bacterium]
MNLDLQHLMRAGTLSLPSLPPLSVYAHLPWCLKKCPYCDFNSHEMPSTELPESAYLDAVCADVEASLPLVWGRQVHSVFIGGGTPSLFSSQGIARLISDLRARLNMVPDCEITLEANPGTFEKDRFHAFRQAGVNRLSVGVQSFNDQHLQALGRVHNADQAFAAVEEAAKAFDTFNIDLMYALPGQSMAQLDADVGRALSLKPPHLSIYHLTIEPNTFFAKHPPADLPIEDTAYDMLDHISDKTQAQGLQRYEVSAYAQAGHRCWHNTNYWQFGDYLGVGAGAHSKISFAHRVMRMVRYRDPKLYMQKAMAEGAVTSVEEISRAQLPFEFMLNTLRLKDGFDLQSFLDRTGLPLSSIDAALDKAVALGLLERDMRQVRPTERGFDMLNDLQALFLAT